MYKLRHAKIARCGVLIVVASKVLFFLNSLNFSKKILQKAVKKTTHIANQCLTVIVNFLYTTGSIGRMRTISALSVSVLYAFQTWLRRPEGWATSVYNIAAMAVGSVGFIRMGRGNSLKFLSVRFFVVDVSAVKATVLLT